MTPLGNHYRCQFGRLFVSATRTRGPGRRLRVINQGVELWLGRWVFIAAVLHRRSCDCKVCAVERYLEETREGTPMSNTDVRLALLSWQSWWQEHGADWYEGERDGQIPNQADKPPVLIEGSPVYGLWLGEDGRTDNDPADDDLSVHYVRVDIRELRAMLTLIGLALLCRLAYEAVCYWAR